MRNRAVIYMSGQPASEEQLANVKDIMERPYDDLSELAELVEDESKEFYDEPDPALEA